MPNKYDLLFSGGLVAAGSGIQKADVGIKGEQIHAVEPELPRQEANRVIDASGKFVMPGVIDVHVHPVYEDDMSDLSFTATQGGTTTLIHFAYAKPGMGKD
jgi:dihydropyrimidinase